MPCKSNGNSHSCSGYKSEVHGFDGIKVPAGEFKARKVVVRHVWSNSMANGEDEITAWFAREVGVVKWR